LTNLQEQEGLVNDDNTWQEVKRQFAGFPSDTWL